MSKTRLEQIFDKIGDKIRLRSWQTNKGGIGYRTDEPRPLKNYLYYFHFDRLDIANQLSLAAFFSVRNDRIVSFDCSHCLYGKNTAHSLPSFFIGPVRAEDE